MGEKKDRIQRQAVVVIHGMGEQRPNRTLRGFVRSLADQIGQKEGVAKPIVYEKPDKISGTYETRSMVMLRDLTVGRPTTHFYEFYWAHHMRDTSWKHITGWLGRLLWWKPCAVPRRLAKVFYTLWGLLPVTILLSIFVWPNLKVQGIVRWISGIGWLTFLLAGAVGFIKSAILNSMGDAARYMSDSPDNIGQRQKIREEGVQLLKHLHTAKDEKGLPLFGRIIVVSHSLGTAVAYDLLRLMWVEYSETYDKAAPPFENTALTKMEEHCNGTLPTGYLQLQHDCWKMQRRAGNEWLITDLVTMGCPLAYFEYLIVGKKAEFEERKKEREYPTCPPVVDPVHQYHWPIRRPGNEWEMPWKELHLLSYSSLYACIRWTNLFYSTDFVGGPLQPILGEGIQDIKVTSYRWYRWLLPYPFGHTKYWYDKPTSYKAMKEIEKALGLNYNPPAPAKA